MVTFPVSPVDLATAQLPILDREAALRSLLHAPVEQLGPGTAPLVICNTHHSLAAAAYQAFYDHRPLVLTPDMIWFCLAQGFAQHVSLHAEELRDRFVRFTGKLTLVVDRPDFKLGQENPWPEAFASFSDQIAAHIGRLRDLVVADFSTTGPVERAALEVLLMDTFQPYFKYEMRIGCGIPSITLLGTPGDWRSVRQRAAMLGEFGLSDWVDALRPVLDQIIATSEGQIDQAFWRSFFRYQSGSMGSEMTGWIQLLFPYLVHHERPSRSEVEAWLVVEAALTDEQDRKLAAATTTDEQAAIQEEFAEKLERLYPKKRSLIPNPYMLGWKTGLRKAEARTEWLSWDVSQGPSLGAIPSSISSAPLLCKDLRDGTQHNLRLVAGLFGVAQLPDTGALQPEFGWAIIYEPDIE